MRGSRDGNRPARRTVGVANAAAALLMPLLLLAGCQEPAPPPDVILITLDTTRADRLGCYGYFRDTTPNLDRLAARSHLFENAYAHMSTTLPAHVSMLTATHTVRHGIRGNLSSFEVAWQDNPEIRIAGTIFSELGYVTQGFVSTAPLKRITGVATGFDGWREPEGNECVASETTEAVLAWLETAPAEPLFLWIHYFDPHDRYSPPPPFNTLYPMGEEIRNYLVENRFTNPDHRQIQTINNQYDGEMRFMDEQIGRVLDKLEELKRFDSAAIVVAGDHGEGMGQHDWVGHGPLNREQLQVPFLVKLPGMNPSGPRRSQRLTAMVDVLPTLIEELELPVDQAVLDQFEGRNALADPGWDFVFSERTHGRPEKLGEGLQFALTGPDWKYLHSTHAPDQLFDLRTDPWEQVNVVDRHPELADSLRARILAEVADARSFHADVDDLPAEYVEELRALGYVD
ncbi:MAG: hypothetical protein DHS20C21_22320 [Gemmatimonadota bacterium]|nr:MAG: hypothetical protein DHS20C21_22320 [Gemmatimonadota bacterium]